MKLSIETSLASRRQITGEPFWVWRVRSDEDWCGSTCLALGINAKSEQEAHEIAERVAAALRPVFGAK